LNVCVYRSNRDSAQSAWSPATIGFLHPQGNLPQGLRVSLLGLDTLVVG
jgi:hypothetical protein